MAINFLNNIASIGTLTITKATTDPLLYLYNTTNGSGAAIRFSDNTNATQVGDITYFHSDGSSQGGGASFHFRGEPDTVVVAGGPSNTGRFVSKSQNNTNEVDYGFYDDVDTGMYRSSANNVSLVAGGVRGVDVGTTAVSLKYAGVTKIATVSGGVDVTGTAQMDTGVTEGIHYVGTAVEHWGDGGTGMSFPANDTLSLRTASSDRLYINSFGNVGIGTTSPTAKLDVAGPTLGNTSGNTAIVAQFKAGRQSIDFKNFRTANENDWNDATFKIQARIDSTVHQSINFVNDASYNEHIDIYTGNQVFNTRFNANGNVGIGTDSPDTKLHVEGNVLIDAYNQGEDNGLFFREGFLTIDQPSITVWDMSNTGASPDGLSINSNDGIRFRENGGEVARFKDGNFGIGTTAPTAKLHVAGSNADATDKPTMISESVFTVKPVALNSGNLSFAQVDSGNSIGMQYTNGSGTANWDISMQPFGGNVGIGTTSPIMKLQVVGDIYANSGSIFIDSGQRLKWGNSAQWIEGTNNTSLEFSGGGSSVDMILLANGNVGIGTTNPSTKLHVSSSGDTILRVTSADGNAAFLDLGDASDPDGGRIVYDSGSNLALYTASSERVRITSAGAIKFNNYDSTNNTGTPTYLLGTDASGNVVKTGLSPATSTAASLYDLIPNGAFTTTYAFTSTAGTYAEVMSGNDVITANGTYSVQMFVNDNAVGGTQYSETYSGVMSWGNSTNTNDTGIEAVSEIVLHRAGHAANSGITYLRTRETTSADNNELKLEIMSNKTYTGASNVVFKFVRLI